MCKFWLPAVYGTQWCKPWGSTVQMLKFKLLYGPMVLSSRSGSDRYKRFTLPQCVRDKPAPNLLQMLLGLKLRANCIGDTSYELFFRFEASLSVLQLVAKSSSATKMFARGSLVKKLKWSYLTKGLHLKCSNYKHSCMKFMNQTIHLRWTICAPHYLFRGSEIPTNSDLELAWSTSYKQNRQKTNKKRTTIYTPAANSLIISLNYFIRTWPVHWSMARF